VPAVKGIPIQAEVPNLQSGVGGPQRHFLAYPARALLFLLPIPPQYELPLLMQPDIHGTGTKSAPRGNPDHETAPKGNAQTGD